MKVRINAIFSKIRNCSSNRLPMTYIGPILKVSI